MSRLAKTATVTIDGEPRKMRLAFLEVERFQKRTGTSFASVMNQLGDEDSDLPVSLLIELVWSSLETFNGEELTRDDVAGWLDFETIGEALAALTSLLPGAEEGEEGASSGNG